MPASEILSSALVAPRSVNRDTAVSAMTSDTVPASDFTHPVQVTSPTVRNRTVSSNTGSSARGWGGGATARNTPSRRHTWRRGREVAVYREQHSVAAEYLAPVGEIDRRQFDFLGADVGPDVELGPVGQREDPDVLTLVVASVVKVPQLR